MRPSKIVFQLSLIISLLTLGMLSDLSSKPESSLIRHVVCFKFKKTASPSEIEKVERAFSELPALIEDIQSLEWGTNNSTEGLDKGFTHCFIVSFKNPEARKKYLPHPDHQKFVSLLKPILDDVFVIDFTPQL